MYRLEEGGSWLTIQLAVKFLYSSPLYFAGEDWSPPLPLKTMRPLPPTPKPSTMIGFLEGEEENKWMFMIMIHNRFFTIIFLNSKFILKD